jgi:hypothetical protein
MVYFAEEVQRKLTCAKLFLPAQTARCSVDEAATAATVDIFKGSLGPVTSLRLVLDRQARLTATVGQDNLILRSDPYKT